MSKSTKTFNLRQLAIATFTVTAALTLSGCLTSPYYGQTFTSRNVAVPFQFWTINKGDDVLLECGKASAHGGLLDGREFEEMSTMTPSQEPHYDYKSVEEDSTPIYQASKKVVIPESCWRLYPYSDTREYMTVIRITQNGQDNSVFTFDRTGLKCLGEWAGFQGFFSWSGQGCEKRYRNTDKPIKTLFLKASR